MAKNKVPHARFPFPKARALVFAAFVAFVVAGLAFRIGTGTPSAFGIDAIAAVCPLGALETMAGAKDVMLHPLLLLIAVVAIIVLVGKAFCAWLCPVPWLQKLVRPKPSRKSAELSAGDATCDATCGSSCGSSCAAEGACPSCALAPVGGKRDGFRLDTRHATLLGALGATAVFGFPVFCLVCPVGLTFATLIGLWHLFQFNETSWGLILFPAILAIEVLVLRKWCVNICPISALVSLISNANRTLRPRVDRAACLRERGIDCRACVDACPEQVDPHSARIPECSKCGACIASCPAQAIRLKLRS
ncbi:4Fe-4S binding protein [Eggerthella sinensis]|jgi:ferredoxin-type protein NapH|uniref:4Fe-4S ferredoxin n=1 Tax=Eggerthella sinensis TaxID=242230 RepID=A0A3N0J226_9ACTN|nr:4Fe-4S binding protein [Eggerthella sinensis]RDB71800.1 4Fe-4S ferredoxin [Eggerthella sinensis]RNM42652.1 4Fe-4S ferredoxin [Eggerthella sinensis]